MKTNRQVVGLPCKHAIICQNRADATSIGPVLAHYGIFIESLYALTMIMDVPLYVCCVICLCYTVVPGKSPWWLLMAWRLLSVRTSANTRLTLCNDHGDIDSLVCIPSKYRIFRYTQYVCLMLPEEIDHQERYDLTFIHGESQALWVMVRFIQELYCNLIHLAV